MSVLVRGHPDWPGWRPPGTPEPQWYERAAGRAIRMLALERNRDGSPKVPDLMLYRLACAYEEARPR